VVLDQVCVDKQFRLPFVPGPQSPIISIVIFTAKPVAGGSMISPKAIRSGAGQCSSEN